jgi:Zn finger protein HypA/HybF involved in hydrogenase expression
MIISIILFTFYIVIKKYIIITSYILKIANTRKTMEENNIRYYCYSCEKSINTSIEIFSCTNCDSCAI